MCRWVYGFLVLVHVFFTIMFLLVVLIVMGVRIADFVRWVILAGWFAICLGGVVLVERLRPLFSPVYRRPILAEEERLNSLMGEVQRRVGSKMRIRFLICGEAEKPTWSLGYRTVVIQSGMLALASDGELLGILAHELGHLRDGDRVMAAAFETAGLPARVFRWGGWLIRRGFRISIVVGLLLLGVLFIVLIGLLPFFLMDGVFRAFRWGLRRQIDYRQDAFAFRAGCGDGLRAWLVRSGLAANVSRIRRLEKMK
jgi:Zn-dependent protease with chaperone function